MVYDVSRNYIGDMHSREDEILQDGDEFELDRGVLIQVGEATGSMEQDLTGLFEKRKKAPEVAVNEEIPHQPVAVPMARSTAAQPSQLRPKTLNALLGTPKRRIGRAVLPTKSPHELRMESENSSWDQDRPAKRQRMESQSKGRLSSNKMPPPRPPASFRVPGEGGSRTVVGAIADKQSEERPVQTTVQNSALPPAGDTVNGPPIPQILRSENIKEDMASKRLVEPLLKKKSNRSGSSDLTAQQRKRKPDQNAQESAKAKKIAKRLDNAPDTSDTRTSTIAKPIEVVSDEDAPSSNGQPKLCTKLQMASRKPRKKLMYRDLLPHKSPAMGQSSGDASVLDRSSRERSTTSRPDKRKKDFMANFHLEEQERLKARLDKHRAKEIHRENEREEFCGDAPEDLFLSQEEINNIPANNHGTEEKQPKEKASHCRTIESRRRHTEPVPSSNRRSSTRESLPRVIPRPSSTLHSTAMALAKMDETLFSRPQPRFSESAEDNDVLPEVLPEGLCSRPILSKPPGAISTLFPPQDQPPSSPAFQTQALVPSSKDVRQQAISTLSRHNLDSLSAFANAVQPKVQGPKRRNSNIPPPDPHLSFIPPVPVNTVSLPSHKDHPMPAPGLQAQPDVHPTRSPTPDPPTADVAPPLPKTKPNSLLAFSKIVAPKLPTAPESVPRHKPSNQPAFTKLIPIPPRPKPPDETVEVLSSQPPSSPPPEAPSMAPHPPKRKHDSLPAFTKVIPTKPRSPLEKSISDTSAMRPPSALPFSRGKEKALSDDSDDSDGKDEGASLWSTEAWDLFGCGRDGVECTYEEFKRQEGLIREEGWNSMD